MTKFVSSKIQMKQFLTINQVLSFYKIAKEYDGVIYLVTNKKAIKIDSLSNLTSFLLLTNKKDQLKVIVEGNEVSKVFKRIQAIFKSKTVNGKIRVFQPDRKIQV